MPASVKISVEDDNGTCLVWDRATSWRGARALLADFQAAIGPLGRANVKILVENATLSCLQWDTVSSWRAARNFVSNAQADFGLIEQAA